MRKSRLTEKQIIAILNDRERLNCDGGGPVHAGQSRGNVSVLVAQFPELDGPKRGPAGR